MTHVGELMQKHLDRYKIKDENRRRSYEDGFHDGYFDGYMEAAEKLTNILQNLVGGKPVSFRPSKGDIEVGLMDPRNVEKR